MNRPGAKTEFLVSKTSPALAGELIKKHLHAERCSTTDALACVGRIASIRNHVEGVTPVARRRAAILVTRHILKLCFHFFEIRIAVTHHAGEERKFGSLNLDFLERDTRKLRSLLDGIEQSFFGVRGIDIRRWWHGFAEVGKECV